MVGGAKCGMTTLKPWSKLCFNADVFALHITTVRVTIKASATKPGVPNKKSCFEPNASYLLEIPYSDDRELLMDILYYGSEVRIIVPKELRKKVASRLAKAVGQYR